MENGVWHGDYDMTVEDAVDMPTQMATAMAGAPRWLRRVDIKFAGSGMRHGITGCANGYNYAPLPLIFAEIGSTADVFVHDLVVSGTHLDGFDTHEDAINWQFVNDTSASDTVDPSDTAGAPTGIGIRGYNSSVIGMRSDGNVICIQDSSQRFPFSGIFYKPSITRWVDPICNNNDIQGGTGSEHLWVRAQWGQFRSLLRQS